MQWQTSLPGQQGNERTTARTVVAPRDCEGVGSALRSAYLPRTSDIPRDMAALLDKLG